MPSVRLPQSADFEELIAPGVLQARLTHLYGAGGKKRVRVGLACASGVSFAEVGWPASRDSACAVVAAGCITKLFTAALVVQAVKAGCFGLDTPVRNLIDSRAGGTLSRVSIRHLLEHTHGIDASQLDGLPRLISGLIDTGALVESIERTPAVAAPGQLYSYSSVGAWLIAALLERLTGETYLQLLRSSLFKAYACNAATGLPSGDELRAADVCPAQGGRLGVSFEDLLSFLRAHAAGQPRFETGNWREEIAALPGWCPLEQGIRLGWKHHGDDWFGHQSGPNTPQAAIVRLDWMRGVAIVIASSHDPPANVGAAVFGALLPEFGRIRVPKILVPQASSVLDLRRYAGVYVGGSWQLVVGGRDGGGLEFRVRPRGVSGPGSAREPMSASLLVPAENHVFFAQPAPLSDFRFVQFTCPTAAGFGYLWNGRCIWRNTGNT